MREGPPTPNPGDAKARWSKVGQEVLLKPRAASYTIEGADVGGLRAVGLDGRTESDGLPWVDVETALAVERYQRRRLPGEGERRLMLEIIEQALRDAQWVKRGTSRHYTNRAREGARAWLRLDVDSAVGWFTARCCFEANGLDYDACMQKIEAAWQTGQKISLTRRMIQGHKTRVVEKWEAKAPMEGPSDEEA